MSLMLRRSLLPSWMDEFFNRDLLSEMDLGESMSMPAVNVIEDKDAFRIEVAAPGLEKKDFKIDVDDKLLTISSEKEISKESKDSNYLRKEFSYTSFRRSFTLPDIVDADKIKASHKDGILTITIPKKEEAKKKGGRTIEIQ